MVEKRIINVLECGADPSGTHDCTAAFRKALEDTEAIAVLVPYGTYKISGLIRGTEPEIEEKTETAPRSRFKSIKEDTEK